MIFVSRLSHCCVVLHLPLLLSIGFTTSIVVDYCCKPFNWGCVRNKVRYRLAILLQLTGTIRSFVAGVLVVPVAIVGIMFIVDCADGLGGLSLRS